MKVQGLESRRMCAGTGICSSRSRGALGCATPPRNAAAAAPVAVCRPSRRSAPVAAPRASLSLTSSHEHALLSTLCSRRAPPLPLTLAPGSRGARARDHRPAPVHCLAGPLFVFVLHSFKNINIGSVVCCLVVLWSVGYKRSTVKCGAKRRLQNAIGRLA